MGPKRCSAKRRSRAFRLDLVAVRSENVVSKWCSPYSKLALRYLHHVEKAFVAESTGLIRKVLLLREHLDQIVVGHEWTGNRYPITGSFGDDLADIIPIRGIDVTMY
jgi:hypothetical protein